MPGDPDAAAPDRVATRVRRAAERWPGIEVDDEALDRLASTWRGLKPRGPGDPADPSELFIAFACVLDSKGAMQAFEERYVRPATVALSSYKLSDDERDEVRQRMRVRLLVNRRNDVPVLLHCAGAGRLGGLVRVVLVREAARLRSTAQPPDLPLELLDDGADTDQKLASHEHQALLKAAFVDATASLEARARTLLRLHYVRGVSGGQIGRMYGVHRGTAARWLESARIDLLRHVHQHLVANAPELERWPTARLRELVHSQLDLSLSRLLADESSSADPFEPR